MGRRRQLLSFFKEVVRLLPNIWPTTTAYLISGNCEPCRMACHVLVPFLLTYFPSHCSKDSQNSRRTSNLQYSKPYQWEKPTYFQMSLPRLQTLQFLGRSACGTEADFLPELPLQPRMCQRMDVSTASFASCFSTSRGREPPRPEVPEKWENLHNLLPGPTP